MKKTISVNIAGMLFHVEEDAYEKLRIYLDGVRRHFSRYDGQSEIVTDIESRIAEIFAGKLSDQRQVVTTEDVDELIRTMGDVKDFQAAEEEPAETSAAPETDSAAETKGDKPSRPIRRDKRRKVIGGVCAGLGHYIGIDPVWLRIGLLLIIAGTMFIEFSPFNSDLGPIPIVLIYLIAWIAIPGSDELYEQPSVKKLYRDRQTAVLGGVASGLAHFTGADRSALRIAFVILAFIGGFGVILYIIFWIAVPEAVSLSEKMSMKGESITLDSIDRSVRDSGKEDDKPESNFTRTLLFPFRLLKRMVEHSGPLIRGLAKVMRIVTGLFLMLLSGVLIIALLVATGVALGIITGSVLGSDWIMMDQDLPVEALKLAFPPLLIASASLAAFIPLLAIFLLGLSITAGRMVIGRYAGWTMAGLFMLSLATLSYVLPRAIMGFAEEATWRVEQDYSIKKGIPVFQGKEVETAAIQSAELEITGHGDSVVRLIRYFEAHGATRKEALANAKLITHQVVQSDSLITIDTNLGLAEGTPFRAQRLRMKLLIPYGKTVKIDRSLLDLSDRYFASESEEEGLETLTADSSGVSCITCRGRIPGNKSSGEASNRLDLRGFNAIRAAGAFDLRIFQANDFAVYRKDEGSMDELMEDFELYIEDETLVIRRRNRIRFDFSEQETPTIIVHLPALQDIDASGAGKIYIDGFQEDQLAIELSGAVKMNAAVDAQHLDAEISGASELELIGRGDHLEVSVSGASKLEADDYLANTGDIEASGASVAHVNVRGELETDGSAGSRIVNRGMGRKDKED